MVKVASLGEIENQKYDENGDEGLFDDLRYHNVANHTQDRRRRSTHTGQGCVRALPCDTIPSDMASVLVIRFSYTGAAPVLTWAFNDDSAGGIEATPVWTNITPGLGGNKIKPADAGVTGASVVLHRPVAGTADAAEIWVTAS